MLTMLQTTRRLLCVCSLLAAVSVQAVASQGDQYAFLKPASGDTRIQTNDKPSLSTLLTITREASIFYDYLRESKGLVERLMNPLSSTTLFIPQNVAITSMVRKPHMGPVPGGAIDELESQTSEKERFAYLEQWLKRHIVNGVDVTLEDGNTYTTLASGEETITVAAIDKSGDDGDLTNYQLQPGGARILSKKEVSVQGACACETGRLKTMLSSQASDGVVYMIDNVLA